jgi:hypothetical protein
MNEDIGGENNQIINQKSSSGSLVAGAVLILGGALVSITGMGVIIGVPLMILGVRVMFPRFVIYAIMFAVFGIIGLFIL